jgi:hypothetical protein
MTLRRQLEHWFESHRVRPRVVAEVAGTALLTDLGFYQTPPDGATGRTLL